MLARLAQWVECRIAKHNWPWWPGFKSHVRTRKIHVAPTGESCGTEGPVVWLRCHGNPRGMITGKSKPAGSEEFPRKTRGFINFLINFSIFFLKFPYCLWYPKPCHSVETSTPSAFQSPANSQHDTTTSCKVGRLTFQFISNTLSQNL